MRGTEAGALMSPPGCLGSALPTECCLLLCLRCRLDMGTADELALDVLINALSTFSRRERAGSCVRGTWASTRSWEQAPHTLWPRGSASPPHLPAPLNACSLAPCCFVALSTKARLFGGSVCLNNCTMCPAFRREQLGIKALVFGGENENWPAPQASAAAIMPPGCHSCPESIGQGVAGSESAKALRWGQAGGAPQAMRQSCSRLLRLAAPTRGCYPLRAGRRTCCLLHLISPRPLVSNVNAHYAAA